MDFRKTFYILPNLFTLSSVVCGFTSLSLSAASDASESNLYLAALAICFGFFFDTFDGRVARLTKTQTDLGRDLDSLADLITFGASPALLVYKWGLTSFGRTGVLIASLFVCAGALRLARFNVLSRREEAAGQKSPGKYTLGLSIPTASSVLVLMVIVSHNARQYRAVSESSTAAIVLVLSALMVSRVRFRSFKDVRLTRKTIGLLLLLGGAIAATLYAGFAKSFIFLLLVSAYIALGLTEEVVFFRSRRAEARELRAAKSTRDQPATVRAEAEETAKRDAEDEEVLRELGAFEPEPAGADERHEGDASGGSGVLASGPGAPKRA